jgi:ribosome-binding factor A
MKQTPASHKVNETARASLARLLLFEISDPRLEMVTVTSVEVSRDRAVADVYIAADPSRYDDVQSGLKSAKGRLRTLLGHELGWRVTPELRFRIDMGVDHAQSITAALKSQAIAHPEGFEAGEAGEAGEAYAAVEAGDAGAEREGR